MTEHCLKPGDGTFTVIRKTKVVLPDGVGQWLHAGDAAIHRHQDLHVAERPRAVHGVRVVAVVYPQVRRAHRALPVHRQVERGGVDAVRLHLNAAPHSNSSLHPFESKNPKCIFELMGCLDCGLIGRREVDE